MIETTFDVPSMSCGSCVHHVGEALGDIDGVEHVDVRLSERRVRVRHDPGTAPIDRLLEALAAAGYDATQAVSPSSW